MATTDSNNLVLLQDTDDLTPLQTTINTITTSISAAFDEDRTRLDTLEDVWTTYTPSWTNLSVMNGSLTARYRKVGKSVNSSITLVFGSTTSLSTNVYVSVPVTPSSGTTTNSVLGTVGVFDSSAPAWRSGSAFRSGSTVRLILADGTNLGAGAPWTWTTGDILTINLNYEAA